MNIFIVCGDDWVAYGGFVVLLSSVVCVFYFIFIIFFLQYHMFWLVMLWVLILCFFYVLLVVMHGAAAAAAATPLPYCLRDDVDICPLPPRLLLLGDVVIHCSRIGRVSMRTALTCSMGPYIPKKNHFVFAPCNLCDSQLFISVFFFVCYFQSNTYFYFYTNCFA